LVEIDGRPCIKISEDMQKATFPGRKNIFRFYDSNGFLMCDLLTKHDEPEPKENEKILCKHPFFESKRAFFKPSKVELLQKLYWSNGKIQENCTKSIQEIREYVNLQLSHLREDHKRHLNPTPYKVSVTQTLYSFIRDTWEKNAPIGQID
jgi:nicotinate phosphoribosyltransferase